MSGSNSKLTTYKFVFYAEISTFIMKAKISSPIFITWKRSQETAKSANYDMKQGKVDFSIDNQKLQLPVNMYYDTNADSFQQKKSVFNFTMVTPKGEKVAGAVYIDLSKMLNNKLDSIEEDFPLEKCPVKDSTVHMRISSECLGEKSGDTMSQASQLEGNQSMMSTVSMLSVNNSIIDSASKSNIEQPKKVQQPSLKKATLQISSPEQVKSLQQKIALLTKINKRLQTELAQANKLTDDNVLKQQLIQSKQIQNKMEEQAQYLRKLNIQHEKQLQNIRQKLEMVYNNMENALTNSFM